MLRNVARVVAAYVANNHTATEELPNVIHSIHAALAGVGALDDAAPELIPAVPVQKSIRADSLVCLECGKPQKTLKRHIATAHGLSVDSYRARWGLATDYPMVAPNYAELRSQLAKKIGLGTKQAKSPPPVVNDDQAAATTDEPTKRGHHYPTNRWSKPTEA